MSAISFLQGLARAIAQKPKIEDYDRINYKMWSQCIEEISGDDIMNPDDCPDGYSFATDDGDPYCYKIVTCQPE